MPQDLRLINIARMLCDNPHDCRRLDEWATWAVISPRTLTRRFSSETGFSFSVWRQRARLIRSLKLLAEGKSVTTIALDLGYENVSVFIALFHHVFGTTELLPVKYYMPMLVRHHCGYDKCELPLLAHSGRCPARLSALCQKRT